MQMQLMLSYRPTSDNIVKRPIRLFMLIINICLRTIRIFYGQKMKLAKLTTTLVIFAITILLGGCAPEISLTLPESEIDTFYKPNDKKSGKATLYLICGKEFYDSWLHISYEKDRICQYKINGEIYKSIGQNGVGRLDINPGKYVIKQIPEAGTFSSDNMQTLEMRAGDIAFCKADHSWYVGFLQGPLNANHTYPVECEKEHVLVQIKAKKPVRMEIMKTTESHDSP